LATHASTLGRATIGFADGAEIDTFVETLERYERGEIDPDAWRAFRLVAGTYGQRQDGGLSMLRAKIPQGVLDAAQLEAIADVAESYSRGFAHITTRQNLQFHFLTLGDVAAAMGRLGLAGITTREACGNAVRNLTTSPTAGVAVDELFDPTPYAEALTRYLLRHPLSSSLPRKFKIAFTGGGSDHAFALINDLGWHARMEDRDGRVVRGFRLTVGGGTALWCQSGRELFAFLPASDMFGVTLAILRVFHRHGDRVHRHKNRVRYMIKAMGWTAFTDAFHAELARVRQEGVPPLPFDGDVAAESASEPRSQPRTSVEKLAALVGALVHGDAPRGPGLTPRHLPLVTADEARFRRTNVAPQRQPGYSVVTVTVPLGDLSSGRLRALACIARHAGEGAVRTTTAQNIVLRWVRDEDVDTVYRALQVIGLASPDPDSIADVTSCPGAESCRLAVTQSRGLARELGDSFSRDRDFVDRAAGLVVKVSGCPNGCGLHHVAGLGFQGGLRKVDGRAAPYYHVYAGGDPSGDVAKFGRVIGKLPARRVPEGTRRLIALYEARRDPGESITAYLARAPLEELRGAIADLEALDGATADASNFVDFAEDGPFRPETTEGECAA
jgi:sulfite reductase (NADPH) hemoprotein beta-component